MLITTTRPGYYNHLKNPFSSLRFWVSHSLQNLHCIRRNNKQNGMVINNAVFCSAPGFLEEQGLEDSMEEMNGKCEDETLEEKNEVVEGNGECGITSENETLDDDLIEKKNEVTEGNNDECGNDTFDDLVEEKVGGESSTNTEVLLSENAGLQEEEEEQCQSSAEDDSSPSPSMGWEVQEMDDASNSISPHGNDEDAGKKDTGNEKFETPILVLPVLEVEMMKERFAKLLLGEDMSGCGNGVPTALAISNAITNLCATLFGQLWRLEPLPAEKKAMWRREIEWLLCVSDHIVELKPTWQNFPNGTKLEVMTCRPRSDLYINLPALRKLDNMLLEILDSFVNTEFRYVDQGVLAPDTISDDGSSSFRRALQRQEDKWWLPVPQVPPCGLRDDSRKQLQHKRDCANQILKAAMAINNVTLAEMEIPDTYLESLPKTARSSLGDVIYRYITSENFSLECLLACLDLSSEHQAIEIANRVEASVHIWHRKTNSKPPGRATRYSSRSSWEMFKDLIVEGDKREMLVERAESILLSLKQRFPGLPQTTLDTSKIQCNKDVGKSILESYSRVLESLASNIVARIDDVLYVDDLAKHSDQFSCLSKIGAITHKGTISVPYSVPNSPYKSGFGGNINPQEGAVGVNKVLTGFLSVGRKWNKDYGCPIEKLDPTLAKFDEVAAFERDVIMENRVCSEEDVKHKALDQAWIE